MDSRENMGWSWTAISWPARRRVLKNGLKILGSALWCSCRNRTSERSNTCSSQPKESFSKAGENLCSEKPIFVLRWWESCVETDTTSKIQEERPTRGISSKSPRPNTSMSLCAMSGTSVQGKVPISFWLEWTGSTVFSVSECRRSWSVSKAGWTRTIEESRSQSAISMSGGERDQQ